MVSSAAEKLFTSVVQPLLEHQDLDTSHFSIVVTRKEEGYFVAKLNEAAGQAWPPVAGFTCQFFGCLGTHCVAWMLKEDAMKSHVRVCREKKPINCE